MWSGPRNLSTALMRSFENREDTNVWDEPFYAYYLNKTQKNHPLKKEIISKYETNFATDIVFSRSILQSLFSSSFETSSSINLEIV